MTQASSGKEAQRGLAAPMDSAAAVAPATWLILELTAPPWQWCAIEWLVI